VQHLGDVVDRRRVGAGDDGFLIHVAHQRDLALDSVGDVHAGPADDRVRLDAHLTQRRHRVLRRLGLQLSRGSDVGHQRHVQEEHVLPAHIAADLAGGLEEGQRFDIADGATDLVDHHVHLTGGHREHLVLDLVGDVRDHLHGVTEKVAAALLGDHRGVHLARGHIGIGVEVDVEEALVVADVEVGLGAVLGDEDLTVLERVHRARIDVQVRIQLLHRDPQPACHQQAPQAGGGQPFAQRGDDPSGDEYVFGLRRVPHGVPAYTGRGSADQPDAPRTAWPAAPSRSAAWSRADSLSSRPPIMRANAARRSSAWTRWTELVVTRPSSALATT